MLLCAVLFIDFCVNGKIYLYNRLAYCTCIFLLRVDGPASFFAVVSYVPGDRVMTVCMGEVDIFKIF